MFPGTGLPEDIGAPGAEGGAVNVALQYLHLEVRAVKVGAGLLAEVLALAG